MGMSAAERMRKYRERLKHNDEKYGQYLEKEKDRYRKRKDQGKIVKVCDATTTEQRLKRRKWRIEKRNQRKRNKERSNTISPIVNITPPQSPESNPAPSVQRVRARKVKRKDKSKVYRELKKLRNEIETKRKESNKYRKRFERLLKKTKEAKSPRKLLNDKLKGHNINSQTRKQLLFNSVVVQGIKRKMELSKSEKQRQLVSKLLSGEILKKYKLMSYAKTCNISFKRLSANAKRSEKTQYERKPKRNAVNNIMKKRVKQFLEKDINSRMMPGKRDTITRHGKKMQKRLLNDTLLNLHKSFNNENPTFKMSYQTFCRLRPFWIVDPKCDARDTCTCKLHANAQFMLNALIEHKVLAKMSVREVCERVCCEKFTKECMYGECDICKVKKLECDFEEFDEGKQVCFYSWKNKCEDREKTKPNGEKTSFTVQITIKEKEQCTLKSLLDDANSIVKSKLCRHEYNMRHQFKQIRSLKENLSQNECIIHVDFSENYACKMSTEVQAMHFGASRNQVSLHTGVLYEYDKEPTSFCTLSDSTRHDPAAIWAHLDPILLSVRATDSVDTVHFISDGPTTQYRSRKNFYLMNERVLKMYNFKSYSWNFTEAGHGKGAPDGVGGLVKRTADKAVSFGKDVNDASDMINVLTDANINVKLHLVSQSDVENVSTTIPQYVKPVPNTMKLHQIFWGKDSSVMVTRVLSCFCKKPAACTCFSPHNFQYSEHTELQSSQTEVQINVDATENSLQEITEMTPLVSASVDNDLTGQWCVVKYDGTAFPGIVLDVDENELEVKVMHKIGVNRFFWPRLDDVIWYDISNVITLIPEPTLVTKRHYEIRKNIWNEISLMFD